MYKLIQFKNIMSMDREHKKGAHLMLQINILNQYLLNINDFHP